MAIKLQVQSPTSFPIPNPGRKQLFFNTSGILSSVDENGLVEEVCRHGSSVFTTVLPILRARLGGFLAPVTTPVGLVALGWYVFEFTLLVTTELATRATVGFAVTYPDPGDGFFGQTASLVRDSVGTTTFFTNTERGKLLEDAKPRGNGGPYLTTIYGSFQATQTSAPGLGFVLCATTDQGLVTVDGVGRLTRLN